VQLLTVLTQEIQPTAHISHLFIIGAVPETQVRVHYFVVIYILK